MRRKRTRIEPVSSAETRIGRRPRKRPLHRLRRSTSPASRGSIRTAGRAAARSLSGAADPRALAVAAFWRAAGFSRWFAKDDRFDALVRLRLAGLRARAEAGLLDGFADTAVGAAALLILLDQAPRNLFRGIPRAFATDGLAVAVAEAAVERGFDRRVPPTLRWFFYLPFEHAEDMALQRRSVALFARLGDEQGLLYARLHEDVIKQFGRFPHRNAILGRPTTAAEADYLKSGGFAG